MKVILITLLTSLIGLCNAQAQTENIKFNKMKLNAGIITEKIKESKDFYLNVLNFGVSFENDFYLLLHTPDKSTEISFLLPKHTSQQPLFQEAFSGKGVYLTIEVDDVNKVYQDMKHKKIDIKISLREEPWGDKHFAIQDPNGIGIDFVEYAPPLN